MTKLALPKLTTICAILTVSAATAISTEADSGKAPAPYQWYVKISVQSGTMSDPDNVIGWLPDSVPGFDSHDLQTMPPFAPPYLTLVFNHSNWGKNSGDYDTDFRFAQPQLAVETWDFQIRSSVTHAPMTLTWTGPDHILARSTLIDIATKATISAKKGKYVFEFNGTRNFQWQLQ